MAEQNREWDLWPNRNGGSRGKEGGGEAEEGGSGNSWIDAVEAERMIGSFLATRGHGNRACRDQGVPRHLRTSSFPSLSPLSPLPSSRLHCPSSSLEGFNVANSLLIWSPSVALQVHLRGSTSRTSCLVPLRCPSSSVQPYDTPTPLRCPSSSLEGSIFAGPSVAVTRLFIHSG